MDDARAPAVPSGEVSSAPPLEEQLNDLLWETTTYVELMGEAALAGTPLTLASSGMLATVLGEPGITVAEMSRRIPKTQQAISQLAARLEKLGLLERRLGSGRGVGLFVTATGRELAEEGLRREHAHAERLRALLGSARCDELSRLLAEAREILRAAQAGSDA
jgi:DNA-binding MarR family transcriptional regulator